MNPVEKAVMPLKEEAVKRADGYARELVDKVARELEENNWDIREVAPFPSSLRESRKSYIAKKSKYDLYNSFTSLDKKKHPTGSLSFKEPHYVVIDPARVERFVEMAREDAAAQYNMFVAKLIQKAQKELGENLVDAELEGDHVWGYSFLTVTGQDGEQAIWKTQMILNVSKLGKVFNQWPSRKVKVKV